jgi:iron complex outermembrane receptor protein
MRFLPFIPPSKLRTEWRAEKASIGAFSDAYFTVHYAYYFAQNRIYGAYQTETRTASYGLLGASVGASLTIGKKRTNVLFRLGIENALNTVYQAHLSRLKYAPVNPLTGQQGIYNMGRNVSLKLIFTR